MKDLLATSEFITNPSPRMMPGSTNLCETGKGACISKAISWVGSLMLIIFGIKSYLDGMTGYAACLFAFATFTILNNVFYVLYGNWMLYRNYLVAGFSLLYLFLLATGGEGNTGLLWCYAYPLMIVSFIGHRKGMWIILAMLGFSAVILFKPNLVWATHQYTADTCYRFAGSISFVSLMAYLMERSRMLALEASDRANQDLRKQARTDEMTGMYNRRGIKQKVQLELHRVARDKTEVTLVLCDIDFFKRINDKYGHDVGDQALKHVARLLSQTIRVTDVVGRWGGEEFLILLPNTRLQEGYQLIERVREKIAAEPFVMNDIALNLSISCGICSTQFFSRFDDLVKAADVSLYEAKSQGRNCTRPILAKTQSA